MVNGMPTSPDPRQTSSPPRVLVVDDDPIAREMASETLSAMDDVPGERGDITTVTARSVTAKRLAPQLPSPVTTPPAFAGRTKSSATVAQTAPAAATQRSGGVSLPTTGVRAAILQAPNSRDTHRSRRHRAYSRGVPP